MRKLKILVGTACLLVVAGLWFWRFQITEEERVQISDVVYSAGEAVPFGENFFWSNSENSNGYTITVDSAQTRNVREFLEENGASWEEVYPETENALPPSEVVYLMSTEQTPVFFAAPKYPAMLSKLAKGRTESYGDSARGPTWQSHEQRFPAALQ